MMKKNGLRQYNILLHIIVCVFLISGCDTASKTIKIDDNNFNDTTQLSGLKAVFFGDSITQNLEEKNQSYPDIVHKLTGLEVDNFGMGGSSLSTHPSESFNAFSFHSLTDAIVSEDFSAQHKALEDPEIPSYFEEKLEKLENISWDDVDIMVLMFGANDWGKPIENPEDPYDVNTFLGAGRKSVEQILEKYPHIQLLFVPSIYRFWPDYDYVDSDTSENLLGIKPYEYSEAMENLADEFNFPSTDTLESLGINKYNRDLYFGNEKDGTHPNELGTEKLGRMVARTLLLYY